MKIEQELNRIKNRIGLVSGSLKINEYDDLEENVSAHIDPKNWNVEINLRRGFNPINERRQKAYARKRKIEKGLETLLKSLSLHEFAHWELPFSSGYGCPSDPYNHDLIVEAVKGALPEGKQSQASYAANAFEDLMINPRAKQFDKEHFNGNFEGQVLFWDDQGFQCRRKGQECYTPFYEAFVKLNMHLFGDNVDKDLLKRHYSNNEKVDNAVKKTIQELNLPESIQDTSVLFRKEQWPRMASIFTKNLSDLLDVKPTEDLSAFSDERNGNEQQKSGNGIEQKVNTREGKEEIAYGRYKSDKGLSPNIPSYEQLDSLYKKLARSIPVQVKAMTRKQSLEIAPLNFRPFDPELDDIRKIKPTKLYIGENGLTFGHKRQPITIKERSKIQRRSFPDFKMIVLDNSGSMAEGINGNQGNTTYIPWGDNSKYHYALLGFYGIEQFLQAQGIAQYIGHGLSLFSSSTKYEEANFRDLHRLRKNALSPEFGSTRINADVLLNALHGRESFVLSISDGEIANWDQAKSDFKRLASENYFGHIQIGKKNQFTSDLESNNFPVFYVNSGEELSKLMVNIASDTYKKFTQNETTR